MNHLECLCMSKTNWVSCIDLWLSHSAINSLLASNTLHCRTTCLLISSVVHHWTIWFFFPMGAKPLAGKDWKHISVAASHFLTLTLAVGLVLAMQLHVRDSVIGVGSFTGQTKFWVLHNLHNFLLGNRSLFWSAVYCWGTWSSWPSSSKAQCFWMCRETEHEP